MWISKKKLAELENMWFEEGRKKELRERLDYLAENTRLKDDNFNLRKQCEEIPSKVREQSKADMMFAALKVIIEGLKPDKTVNDINNEYAGMRLAQQTAAMQYDGILGRDRLNLLGGLFGR